MGRRVLSNTFKWEGGCCPTHSNGKEGAVQHIQMGRRVLSNTFRWEGGCCPTHSNGKEGAVQHIQMGRRVLSNTFKWEGGCCPTHSNGKQGQQRSHTMKIKVQISNWTDVLTHFHHKSFLHDFYPLFYFSSSKYSSAAGCVHVVVVVVVGGGVPQQIILRWPCAVEGLLKSKCYSTLTGLSLCDLKACYTTHSWATWRHTILFYMSHTKLWFQTLYMCTMLNV